MRSSRARTWLTVHFSSFSNRRVIVRRVPGTSSAPCALNCAYSGCVARDGDAPSASESAPLMGEAARLGGVLTTPRGMGDGEEDMARPGEAESPSFMKAGSSNLPSGVVGHSLLFLRSCFSIFFFSFSITLSRCFVSWMICCAGVRDSLVGVSLCLAADHQPPSF
ncbi:hypothetical protein GSI_08997 [Ganoderma sinense ZZ0214-1]|uniref:Uncharacterized protein n=1 Tax=Ganoderma sinense ZZ0214-1 TaxID=1077348 RepID=A0A2G8S5A5_9APHY|nr:hypothetical protein GSI_08997 [Ganoderma sinense ZZ0214-1]